MIQYLKVDDKEYPFLFSMRAVFDFMNKANLMALDDVSQAISLDYDLMLDLFAQASKKGAKKENSDLTLSAEQIEDLVDEEPEMYFELQDMFDKSQVIQTFNEKFSDAENVKKK